MKVSSIEGAILKWVNISAPMEYEEWLIVS